VVPGELPIYKKLLFFRFCCLFVFRFGLLDGWIYRSISLHRKGKEEEEMWSIRSHKFFPKSFRDAINNLLLLTSTHKYNCWLPKDIRFLIIEQLANEFAKIGPTDQSLQDSIKKMILDTPPGNLQEVTSG
jgi:hypothetical protein